jgi:Flp pilus assembly protein TadD
LTTRGLTVAKTLDPDEREFATIVYEKLVDAWKRAHRFEDARLTIERSRKLLGNEGNIADRLLVSLFRDTGNRTEALKALRDLRLKEPEDVTLLRLQATLLAETGQVEKGVELMRQRIASGKAQTQAGALPRLDDEVSNYLFIAQLYNDVGKGSEAVAAADEALQAAGSEDRRRIAQLMKASAQQTAGQYAAAETILREILKATPRNPMALNNLGYFLLERGESFTEAFGLIKQAVEIDPTNPSYLDSLGWAHFKLGQIDDAIKSLEQAARLNDSSATIQEHLGDVYLKNGWSDRARSSFQKASVLSSAPADLARVRKKLASIK